jgi:hypothetical protein
MGFYQTQNLATFKVQNPMNLIQSKLQLLNSTISVPLSPSVYDSANPVVYSAVDLLNGYIIRQGQNPLVDTVDQFDTASNIIEQLRIRYTSITNKAYSSTGPSNSKVLPPGTSFECKLYNNTAAQYVTNNNGLTFYSNGDNTVRIGGGLGGQLSYQITNGATAILEIVVQDQAALGPGHQDQVFICISRCATWVQLQEQPN